MNQMCFILLFYVQSCEILRKKKTVAGVAHKQSRYLINVFCCCLRYYKAGMVKSIHG